MLYTARLESGLKRVYLRTNGLEPDSLSQGKCKSHKNTNLKHALCLSQGSWALPSTAQIRITIHEEKTPKSELKLMRSARGPRERTKLLFPSTKTAGEREGGVYPGRSCGAEFGTVQPKAVEANGKGVDETDQTQPHELEASSRTQVRLARVPRSIRIVHLIPPRKPGFLNVHIAHRFRNVTAEFRTTVLREAFGRGVRNIHEKDALFRESKTVLSVVRPNEVIFSSTFRCGFSVGSSVR